MRSRHNSGMSLAEIADRLGLTKQAVYQIELRAMKKLRAALGSQFTGPIGEFLIDSCGEGDDSGQQCGLGVHLE